MKKTILFLTALFLAMTGFAQQGINYKAIITDNGTVLQNHTTGVYFTVLENGVTSVYEEIHSAQTDANGILILNIGEGNAIVGNFTDIDWRAENFLKVEVDTGSGSVDMGTTAFKSVPNAKAANYLKPTDKVVIGETDNLATEKLYVKNQNPDIELVDFRVGNLTSGKDILNLYIEENTSSGRSQFIEASKGSELKFKVNDDGGVFVGGGMYVGGGVLVGGGLTIENDFNIFSGDLIAYNNATISGELTTGDLSVTGNVTSDLEMGDNEIHATDSGDADMKAYAYGEFYVSDVDAGIMEFKSTSGFTVSRIDVGKYRVAYNQNVDFEFDTVIVLSVTGAQATNAPFVPSVVLLSSVRQGYFYVKQFDLSGNPTDNYTITGSAVHISFVIYKK